MIRMYLGADRSTARFYSRSNSSYEFDRRLKTEKYRVSVLVMRLVTGSTTLNVTKRRLPFCLSARFKRVDDNAKFD